MLRWGSLTAGDAVHRSLEEVTSNVYRAEHPEDLFDLIMRWRLAESPSPIDFYQQMMAGARFNASAAVAEIPCPRLVIHGADDRYVPLVNAAALAEAIPDARLRVIEDAGHLVFIEKAKEVSAEIVSFLKPGKWWRVREALKLQEARKSLVSEKLQ